MVLVASEQIPLHPAVVHLPLGLALAMPVVLAVVWWTLREGAPEGRGSRLVALTLQLLLAVGAFVALRTGEAEEDAAERVVGEERIEEHAERGQAFAIAGGVTLLVLAAGTALGSRRAARGTIVVALLASLGTTVLAYRVGHSGGELVYVHGAGRK